MCDCIKRLNFQWFGEFISLNHRQRTGAIKGKSRRIGFSSACIGSGYFTMGLMRVSICHYDCLERRDSMDGSFFALISRMRYISRWGLMRNSTPENIQEHSHMVAVLAHALAVIRRDIFKKPCNPDRAATLALFHDASEILTGDLPTPIKYNNPDIRTAYKNVEHMAAERLLGFLPQAIRCTYAPLLCEQDSQLYELVKAADKLSAYIKCIDERKAGNTEFLSAERSTKNAIAEMELPEADYFFKHFLPAFEWNLDELGMIE